MFRNQYDSDVTVWSPQGRIHQIEYAMEAVKQGSATVGIKSKTHAVVVALKRAANELSSHQKKVIPIDDHVGVSVAGLLSDARLLAPATLANGTGPKFSEPSSPADNAVLRLLKIGIERDFDRGSHIYQTCPSSNVYACKAMSIGARSQSARTYLEKHLNTFENCSLEELIQHALLALRDTLPNEIVLSTKNTTVGVVGKGLPFTIFDDKDVEPYLDRIRDEPRAPVAASDDVVMEPSGEQQADDTS